MYPLTLDIAGKPCVVIGGGHVAARKVRGLVAAGARVRVISPELTGELAELARREVIAWVARPYRSGDLAGALLVFAATNVRAVQEAVAREALAAGQLVNVADAPQRCTFQVPAMVRRGDLLLTVSTAGRSPAAAAMIRQQLERDYGPEYELLLEIMALIRQKILARECSPHEKEVLFQSVIHNDMIKWIKEGQWELLQHHLRAVLGAETDLELPVGGQYP